MSAITNSPQSRPHGAPAYYLARPASWWITGLRRQPQQRLTPPAATDLAEPAPIHLATGS